MCHLERRAIEGIDLGCCVLERRNDVTWREGGSERGRMREFLLGRNRETEERSVDLLPLSLSLSFSFISFFLGGFLVFSAIFKEESVWWCGSEVEGCSRFAECLTPSFVFPPLFLSVQNRPPILCVRDSKMHMQEDLGDGRAHEKERKEERKRERWSLGRRVS